MKKDSVKGSYGWKYIKLISFIHFVIEDANKQKFVIESK